MNPTNLIEKFYSSFAIGDVDAMLSCYHPDVTFQDPAFGLLDAAKARAMWSMLVARSKGDIKIKFSNIQASETEGSAQWEADYHFSQTGNAVNNKINAQFEFKEGLIIKHVDTFDMWRWSRQALGWKGWLLGWTPFMENKIQATTNTLLKAYMSKPKG